MVLAGNKSYIYWGTNATFKSGNPAADTHQAFNPMISFEGAVVRPIQASKTTCDKEYPNIIYDEKIEQEPITISTYYRDPFLLLAMFGYKGVTTTWTGTGDVITGTFASKANRDDDIWIQVHLHDQDEGSANDNEILYDGGTITAYRWIIENGQPLIEEVDILFAECTENSQAVDIDNGFDDGAFDRAGIDGGWSLWDGAYTASTCAHSSDVTITKGGSAIVGIDIEKATLEITAPKQRYWVQSSLTANADFDGLREPYKCTVEGYLTSNASVSELLALIGAKTQDTLKIQYGTTKYLEFTNSYIQNIEPPIGLPEAGEGAKVTYTIVGGADSVLTYSWTANEATDPSTHINHTDV